MYRCSEVLRLVASDEYLTAGPFKKLRIGLHLAMCRHCTRYLRQLRALGATLREAGSTVLPSEIEAVKAQILQQLFGK